jgi:hypothetical protein
MALGVSKTQYSNLILLNADSIIVFLNYFFTIYPFQYWLIIYIDVK